jgi:hypothetical protein
MMYVFRAVAGFAVAVVAIGGLWWFGTSALFRPLVPVEPAASAPNAPVSGAGPGHIATPLAVEPRSADSGNRVYACRRGSEVVYADHPCGKDAAVQSLDPARLNLYHATPAPEVSSNSPPAVDTSDTNPAGSNASAGSANDDACALIEAQIRTIDERTRHPYTAQEGEDLRSHRHRLEAERWRLRCGW